MGSPSVTWEEAVKATTTAFWYLRYSTQLMTSGEAQNLSLSDFTSNPTAKFLGSGIDATFKVS